MTDPALEGIAAQAFNMAKLDLERGSFNFLLASYYAGEGLHRMRQIEALIISRLGENWLNSGQTKDIGFQMLRMACDALPPEAFVFATVINKFEPTAKLRALPPEEYRKLINAKSHEEHHAAVKQGLLAVHDALACTAQTSERVCLYTQTYYPKRIEPIGRPDVQFFNQSEFAGRMKMFGEENGR
jgi:hypothetical protein